MQPSSILQKKYTCISKNRYQAYKIASHEYCLFKYDIKVYIDPIRYM